MLGLRRGTPTLCTLPLRTGTRPVSRRSSTQGLRRTPRARRAAAPTQKGGCERESHSRPGPSKGGWRRPLPRSSPPQGAFSRPVFSTAGRLERGARGRVRGPRGGARGAPGGGGGRRIGQQRRPHGAGGGGDERAPALHAGSPGAGGRRGLRRRRATPAQTRTLAGGREPRHISRKCMLLGACAALPLSPDPPTPPLPRPARRTATPRRTSRPPGATWSASGPCARTARRWT